MNEDRLHRLIARLYQAGVAGDSLGDSPGDPPGDSPGTSPGDTPWQPIVQGLVDLMGARTGWVYATPGGRQDVQMLGAVGASAEAMRDYAAYYHAKDPWRAAEARLPGGALFLSHDHVAAADFTRSEIFADYVRPHFGNTVWALAARLPLGNGDEATFAVHRQLDQGAFGAVEIRTLRTLRPHLQHALVLRRQVGALREQRDRAWAALHALPGATGVLDGTGRILFANTALETLLRQADGIAVLPAGMTPGGRVQAQGPAQAVFARALATAGRPTGAAGQMLRIHRPSGARPWTVLLAPLQPESRPGDVLLLVADPDRAHAPAIGHLTGLFGLTPSEASLAVALASGLRVEEIARARGIGLPTARTQLAAVLAKTNTHRQPELLRLLLTLPQVAAGI